MRGKGKGTEHSFWLRGVALMMGERDSEKTLAKR